MVEQDGSAVGGEGQGWLARALSDRRNVIRDLRTLVARDDDGEGWDSDHVSYLLDLEAEYTRLIRTGPES